MSLTLYHSPQSRSSRFLWLLEETGADYGVEYVSIRRQMTGEGAPDPRNPSPAGKVPYLVHNGVGIGESVAIAIYLADAFPEAKLAPPIGDPGRGPFLQWCAFYAAEMEPMLFALFADATTPQAQTMRAYVHGAVTAALDNRPYIAGNEFTAADVLVSSVFQWAPDHMPKGPAIDAYLQRIAARPALARALAKEQPPQ